MDSEEPKNIRVGRMGENLGCKFLVGRGYSIIEKNYTRKWGEIDIIAKKGEVISFIEVKTVSREITDEAITGNSFDEHRPEDNVHSWKLKRLSRVIQTYISHEIKKEDIQWQFDILTVLLDIKRKKVKIYHLKDIVL